MERLWAPWRMAYIDGSGSGTGDNTRQKGCIFCDKPAEAKDGENLIVHRGRTNFVILNAFPYNNGHLMVVPYRHESTLAGLTRDEMDEVGLLLQRSETVLREAYRLEGINVGVNLGAAAGAGIEEHVHVHVVPRWNGDTNFMPVLSDTKVIVQSLDALYDLLTERLRGERGA